MNRDAKRDQATHTAARRDVTLRRVLSCATHGVRKWRGHVMCDACGETYQTTQDREPRFAPDTCGCGLPLLPPRDRRVGDAIGVEAGGFSVTDGGASHRMPAGTEWTARAICYLCFRWFERNADGRVPVDAGPGIPIGNDDEN